MNYLIHFDKFNEALGVADATLPYVNVLSEYVTDAVLEFIEECKSEDSMDVDLILTLKYDDLKPYLPKRSIYAWFPVSKIDLNLKLVKEEDKWQKYPFKIGGYASHFGKKKEEHVSKFKKGVKKNKDHSISLDMGIEVYVGTFNPDIEADYKMYEAKLESVILHELNHLYEYYRRTWDPYGRNIQTSITWASIGETPKGLNPKIYEFWGDNFLYYIYQSEPHEVRAQIQEAKAFVDRMNLEELKSTNLWKNIKKMQNFNEEDFLEDFHEKVLEIDATLIEEDILKIVIQAWKDEYDKLYQEQTEENKPKPEFFYKMSDMDFIQYWGKKIREAGTKMVRGVLRQYSNKKED